MAEIAKVMLHTSVQRPETTTFLRPLALSASRTFLSSHEFIDVRSSIGLSGSTSRSSAQGSPEELTDSPEGMVVGSLYTFAALAKAPTLFLIRWPPIASPA